LRRSLIERELALARAVIDRDAEMDAIMREESGLMVGRTSGW
jgi:hypothetical protein